MANLHRRISPDDGITVRRLVPRLFQQYRPGTDICTAAFIDRIDRGFDFLGYHFIRAGLTVAAKTIANFIEKASRH
jgi:hypothetical protein